MLKYSLSSRQVAEYLKKADEIKVEYRDRRTIPDLAEKYPDARINLLPPEKEEDIDWKEIKNYQILSRNNFIFGIIRYTDIGPAKDNDINVYYRFPITTFQELEDVKRAGVCSVILGAPLFFRMDSVAKFEIPVRAIANVAHPEGSFTMLDGPTGTWIRPEDVEVYEQYIDTIEFMAVQKEEQALYRIYAEQHKWPGELNMVVKDLNHSATNRMIPPTLVESRLNCGQRCKETGRCHLCQRVLDLADPDKLRQYLKETENT